MPWQFVFLLLNLHFEYAGLLNLFGSTIKILNFAESPEYFFVQCTLYSTVYSIHKIIFKYEIFYTIENVL
jgi:hypothetical protein